MNYQKGELRARLMKFAVSDYVQKVNSIPFRLITPHVCVYLPFSVVAPITGDCRDLRSRHYPFSDMSHDYEIAIKTREV